MAQADAADRDLLFGVLALQEGLIGRPALVAALRSWSIDPSGSLAGRLRAGGDLGPAEVERVRALVDLHAGEPDPGPATGSTLADHPGATAARDLDATEPAPTLDPGRGPAGAFSGAPRHPGGQGPHFGGGGRARGQGERFRILRPHAQGGLGAVFVAIDDELNREVALKQILRHHADDPRSRARFLIEAEITGGLEHPGIVPVYGLGSDRDGRPYYAMRFIRGGSLKEAIAAFHADPAPKADPGARSLALRELLRRFVDACNAIDYAHGRGVLHRDLKPSNIIVGKHGETLVVDWGLAKATGRHDPAPSDDEPALIPSTSGGLAQTLDGSALGTPSYMSPEAAAGDLKNLGPRSDVYSLGATLYCLLTGRSPFDGTDLVVLIGQIRAGEFPRPRQLDPAIDPALEAIALKAMAPRPADRYGSAGDLAADLLRWSADEPVGAYPEGPRRRLSRRVRRHAAAVAAVGALLVTASAALALTAGLIAVERDRVAQARNLLSVSNRRLAEEKAQSEKARGDAEAGFKSARDAIQRQLVNIAQFDLPSVPQAEKLRLRLQLAEEAAKLYRRLRLRAPSDPTIRHEYARIEEQVASLYRAMGRYEEARERYQAALDALLPDVGQGSTQPRARELLAYIEGQFAEMIQAAGGRIDQNEPHHRRAVTLARDLALAFPKDLEYAFLEARLNADLAFLLIHAGRLEEAMPFALKAAERGRAHDATPPAERSSDEQVYLPLALSPRALILARQGRPEAEPAARELVEVLRHPDKLQPNIGDIQYLLAEALNELAKVVAADPGRRAEALRLQDEAVDRMAPVVAKHPSIVFYPSSLAAYRADRAVTRTALDRLDEAQDDFDRALPVLRAEVGRVKGARPLESLARATADLARLEAKRGRVDDARRHLLEATAGHENALKIDPGALPNVELLRRVRADLAALGGPP